MTKLSKEELVTKIDIKFKRNGKNQSKTCNNSY
jgi:hypothetical protein